MYSNHRRSKTSTGISPILLSLFYQLYIELEKQQFKPIVTIILLGINIFVHIHPYPHVFGYNLDDINSQCIHPRKIFRALALGSIPWNRIIFSSIIHVDDMHLYYNMLSLCWKGINLESFLGSQEFFTLVVFSLIVSHIGVVLISFLLYEIFNFNEYTSGMNSCAVGFSAVLFSLKYVWNSYSSDRTSVMGIMIPTKHAAWLELILISIITPNASFIGHLSGILAGVLYVHGAAKILYLVFFQIQKLFRLFFVGNDHSSNTTTSNYSDSYREPNIELEELDQLNQRADSSENYETIRNLRANKYDQPSNYRYYNKNIKRK